MLTGEKRGVSTRRGGMTVLGKVAVPKPINLPSQRLENRGLDPNVEIVPKGTLSWGNAGRSPPTSGNAWGTSLTSAHTTAGPWNRNNAPTARPSSGGSGTRPSTAGSDQSHEPPTPSAWGFTLSRPSSASGALGQSRSHSTANRPCSAEARPGSSQRSRFAESTADPGIVWGSSGGSQKLREGSYHHAQFNLTSVDFPTLGSGKNPDLRPQQGAGNATSFRSLSTSESLAQESLHASSPDLPKAAISRSTVSQLKGSADTWKREHTSHPRDVPQGDEGNQQREQSQRSPYISHSHASETWQREDDYRAPLSPTQRKEDRPRHSHPVGPYGLSGAHGRFSYNPSGHFPNMEGKPTTYGQGQIGHSGYNRHGETYGSYVQQPVIPAQPGLPLPHGMYGNQMRYDGYYGAPVLAGPHYGNAIDERDLAMRMGGRPNMYGGYSHNQAGNVGGSKHHHTGSGTSSYAYSDHPPLRREDNDPLAQGSVATDEEDKERGPESWPANDRNQSGRKHIVTHIQDSSISSCVPSDSREINKSTKETSSASQHDLDIVSNKETIISERHGSHSTDSKYEASLPRSLEGNRSSDDRKSEFQSRGHGSSKRVTPKRTKHLESDSGKFREMDAQLPSVPENQWDDAQEKNTLPTSSSSNQRQIYRRNVSAQNPDKNAKTQVTVLPTMSDQRFQSDGALNAQSIAPVELERDSSVSSDKPQHGFSNDAGANDLAPVNFRVKDKVQLLKRSDNNTADRSDGNGGKETVEMTEKGQNQTMSVNTGQQTSLTDVTAKRPGTTSETSKPPQQGTVSVGIKHVRENVDDKRTGDSPYSHASHDYESQRVRLKELAVQRAKQRQKQEEERIKEQTAKAHAKLEELNRRAMAASKSQDETSVQCSSGSELGSFRSVEHEVNVTERKGPNSEGMADFENIFIVRDNSTAEQKSTKDNVKNKRGSEAKYNFKDGEGDNGTVFIKETTGVEIMVSNTVQGHVSKINTDNDQPSSGKERARREYNQKSSKPTKEGRMSDNSVGIIAASAQPSLENSRTSSSVAREETAEVPQQQIVDPQNLLDEKKQNHSMKAISSVAFSGTSDGTSRRNIVHNTETNISGSDDVPVTKKKKTNRNPKGKNKLDKSGSGNIVLPDHDNSTLLQTKDPKISSEDQACKSNEEVSRHPETLNKNTDLSFSGANHKHADLIAENLAMLDQSVLPAGDEKFTRRVHVRPNIPKRQHRGLQDPKLSDKHHAVWVRAGNQNVQTSEKHPDQVGVQVEVSGPASNVVQAQPVKSKRAEIERYVPKPAAKEHAQIQESRQQSMQVDQSAQEANTRSKTTVEMRQQSSSAEERKGQLTVNNHAKQSVSWRQRNSKNLNENNEASHVHHHNSVVSVQSSQKEDETGAGSVQNDATANQLKSNNAGNKQECDSSTYGVKNEKLTQNLNNSLGEAPEGNVQEREAISLSMDGQAIASLKDQGVHVFSKKEQVIPDRFYQVNRSRSRSNKMAFRPVNQTEGSSPYVRSDEKSNEMGKTHVNEQTHSGHRPKSAGAWAPKKEGHQDEEKHTPQKEIPLNQIEIGQIKLGCEDVGSDGKLLTLPEKQQHLQSQSPKLKFSPHSEEENNDVCQNVEIMNSMVRVDSKVADTRLRAGKRQYQYNGSNSYQHRRPKSAQGRWQQTGGNLNDLSSVSGNTVDKQSESVTQAQREESTKQQRSVNDANRRKPNESFQIVSSQDSQDSHQPKSATYSGDGNKRDTIHTSNSRGNPSWYGGQRNTYQNRDRDHSHGRRGRFGVQNSWGVGPRGNGLGNKSEDPTKQPSVGNATQGVSHQIAG
eukprot:TRINITY_DN17590_c0_g1_i1.p1 TRINITY_DN17590_c0_g1~~TRINITY_DN17590_c0_g1_i1.p1  ORF type:complete len:1804 (+),score=395.43 TRINITY_DN17590_c0_g1_i1:250-5661(+)